MTDPVQGCDCILLQTGIPSLDWSEALKIHKGQSSQSHYNSQLQMGPQPWGQLPGQPEGGETDACSESGFDGMMVKDRNIQQNIPQKSSSVIG